MTIQHQTFICCALEAEARPIIKFLGLKVCESGRIGRRLRIYSAEFNRDGISYEIKLVITGVGKIKSASACSALLASRKSLSIDVVNFGIAGLSSKDHNAIGQMFCVDSVYDGSSISTENFQGHGLFPEYDHSYGLPLGSLICVDRPQTSCDNSKSSQFVESSNPIPYSLSGNVLFDMESYGVLTANRMLSNLKRTIVLKVVSDLLENIASNTFKRVEDLVSSNLEKLISIIDFRVKHFIDVQNESSDLFIERALNKFSAKIKITSTQKSQLRTLFKGYYFKFKSLNTIETLIDNCPEVNSKSAVASYLNKVKIIICKEVWG